jgi:hypothetical protein
MFKHKSTKYIVGGLLVVIVLSWVVGPFLKKDNPTVTPTEEATPIVAETEEPTPEPPPTATPTDAPTAEATPIVAETEEATPEAEVAGDWVGVKGLPPAGVFLGICHGFTGRSIHIYPVPEDFLEAAVQAYPEAPQVVGLIAMANPVYIPRTSEDAVADIAAWTDDPAVGCDQSPWNAETADAVLNADTEIVVLLGIARPVTGETTGAAWEVIFYALRNEP